jgi:hypothetical protein
MDDLKEHRMIENSRAIEEELNRLAEIRRRNSKRKETPK